MAMTQKEREELDEVRAKKKALDALARAEREHRSRVSKLLAPIKVGLKVVQKSLTEAHRAAIVGDYKLLGKTSTALNEQYAALEAAVADLGSGEQAEAPVAKTRGKKKAAGRRRRGA